MRGRFATLDGLRGIAALAIVLLHTCEATLRLTLPGTGAAVDFFFLLSGFVLAYAYPAPGLDYLHARWVRLWPMVLFGTVLGAVLMLSSGLTGDWLPALLLNGLGLPVSASVGYVFDGPLWSVAFEAIVSVLYFLFARRLSVPVLAVAVVGLALIAPAPASWGWPALIRTLFPFAVGVLLQKLPAPKFGERWAVYSAAALAVLLAVPLLSLPSALTVAILAAILTMGRAEPPRELRAAAIWLGRISFPLYVVHSPLGWWAEAHGLRGPLALIAVMAVSVVVAHLAGRFYDEPVRRWLMRVTAGKPRTEAATAAIIP